MWDSNGSPSHAPFRRHSLVWWAIVIDARPKQIIRYFLMLLEYVGSFDQLHAVFFTSNDYKQRVLVNLKIYLVKLKQPLNRPRLVEI